jgi:hypothetical protein
MMELTESTSAPKSAPTSTPVHVPIPTSSTFCFLLGHLCLWVGVLLVIFNLAASARGFLLTGLSAMVSSALWFAVATLLRQQAVTNHLLERIANKA